MSEHIEEHIEEHTDCLVLEIYSDASNKMFVLYDYYDKCYLLKGLNNFQNDFNFRCKHISDIRNFIDFIFCYSDELTLLVHNYKELPYEGRNISFEKLNDLYETNPYSGDTFVSKKFSNNSILYTYIEEQLKVIKNFYNKY